LPQRLKPSLIRNGFRGPEGPLFHGAARVRRFFRSLYVFGPESVWQAEESAEKRRLGKKNLKTQAAEAEPILSALQHD